MGILAVAVVGLLIAVLLRLRSRRTVRQPGPSQLEEDPPFRIVTLGTRGAGKTLFLASMFHELQVSHGRSYWLTASPSETIALNGWYAQVEDTTRDWPRGTTPGQTRAFTFGVMTRTASNRARQVLRFEYLEYAGGLLTDEQESEAPVQAEVIARIATAQALVCLLDGAQIRLMLDGERSGARAISRGLRATAKYLLEADCPVTFVVTKWDLLRGIDLDDDQRLSLIAKRLRYEPAFDELVRQHTAGRIVRLVPVSAVGDDFVDYVEGAVTKRQDGELTPSNVDVPLAAVVPDIFEQLEQQLESRQLRGEFERLRAMTRLGPAAAAAELAGFVGKLAGGALSGLGQRAPSFLTDAVSELITGQGERSRERDQKLIDDAVDDSERDLQEFRIARRHVLRELRHRVDVLEGRLPSSRLRADD
jgi:hypothetical protein